MGPNVKLMVFPSLEVLTVWVVFDVETEHIIHFYSPFLIVLGKIIGLIQASLP